MPGRGDASIRLACPRCFTLLRASRAQVGTRRRCPRCQWTFEVPTKKRDDRPHGGYGVSEKAELSPPAERPYIAVTCPVCATRMVAAEDQVGQETICPDCGTASIVPPAAVTEPCPPKGPPAEAVGEYLLADEVDPLPLGTRPAEQAYFPVNCPVCNTLMKVAKDQVGRELVCPDCRVPMIVPPVSEGQGKSRAAARRAAARAEYEVGEAVGQPSSGSRAYQPYVLAICPVCETRLHATGDQVGQRIVCPDCDRAFVVPRPRRRPRKYAPPAEAGRPYALDKPSEVPFPRIGVDYRRAETKSDEAPTGEVPGAGGLRASVLPRPTPTAPRWTFFSGVFTFPLYRDAWPRWLVLSMMAVLFDLVAYVIVKAVGGQALTMFVTLMLVGLGSVLSLIWAAVAINFCLAIVRDTAAGVDKVESWPDAMFVDWVLDSFFVINAAILAAVPGMSVASAIGWPGLPVWLGSLVSLGVFFPIILMSMLEKNTPMNPFSGPVWSSVLSSWWAWSLFYFETTVMMVVLACLAGAALVLAGFWGVLIVDILLVPPLMVYFRLLGRLAWYCGKEDSRERRRPAEPQQADTDAVEPAVSASSKRRP